MSTISEDAHLSGRYTNHCLWNTTVNLLREAKQEGRHIIAITQHASVNSLASYLKMSAKRRKTMSDIINFGLSGNDTSNYSEPAAETRLTRPSPTPPPATMGRLVPTTVGTQKQKHKN